MIHFLIGKPRNGKSLRAMLHIVEQLTTTERTVVTNMVIDLDVLQTYLDARGYTIFVRARVFMLSAEESRDFWLYRGFGYVLPKPQDYHAKTGANVDYAPLFDDPRWRVGHVLADAQNQPAHLKGTAYVIDECHTLWPARLWQGTPRHADFYNSQHGKLNDEVWFITQNLKLVDPNFYRLAQDFTYCRNHRLEKHGWFRGDNKFVAKTYGWPAQGPHEPTLNEFTYKLDLDIARCYDTSAGVGMPGGGTADAGHRAKGIPLKTVWIGLAAVLVLCWVIFRYGVPAFSNRFMAAALSPQTAVGSTSPRFLVGRGARPPAGASETGGRRPVPDVSASVRLDGWVTTPSGPVVWLSDGRRLRGATDISELWEDRVQLRDGSEYRVRTRQEQRELAIQENANAIRPNPEPPPLVNSASGLRSDPASKSSDSLHLERDDLQVSERKE